MCVIEDGAAITGSVLWSDVVIESEAQINQAVLGSWCHVGERALVLEGSVVSNRSLIRKEVEVPPRTRLNPNSII
jgi:NDP-sugar pyrophosphorylase family protein